jgi:hypothetical protein
LEECSGVISNAGFELLSEALQIGKKLLVKPLVGQMEQMSNALVVSEFKLGMVMPTLNRRYVEKWLSWQDTEPMGYPDVARLVAEWIDRGNCKEVKQLAVQAWEKTKGLHRLETAAVAGGCDGSTKGGLCSDEVA